uniref:Uncharacterized protein n=1 Tax=Solanum tuberosum TaxID=4113 RepID=M1DQV1_SOLTU
MGRPAGIESPSWITALGATRVKAKGHVPKPKGKAIAKEHGYSNLGAHCLNLTRGTTGHGALRGVALAMVEWPPSGLATTSTSRERPPPVVFTMAHGDLPEDALGKGACGTK